MLGVESELSCWPIPQPQLHSIQAASVTYTIAQGNTGSLTHWARPGIQPASSWMLVRFVSTGPQWELLIIVFEYLLLSLLVHRYSNGSHKIFWFLTFFFQHTQIIKYCQASHMEHDLCTRTNFPYSTDIISLNPFKYQINRYFYLFHATDGETEVQRC